MTGVAAGATAKTAIGILAADSNVRPCAHVWLTIREFDPGSMTRKTPRRPLNLIVYAMNDRHIARYHEFPSPFAPQIVI